MSYRILADLVVIVHFIFIVFALFGGLLVRWRTLWLLLHVPAVMWVAMVSFTGEVCPLTPLENQLRQAAGSEGYSGGFVEYYLIPIIYPVDLHVDVQRLLGVVAVGINIAIYVFVYCWYSSNKNR